MKTSARSLSAFGIGIAALGSAACSGGGAESMSVAATGELSLAITDAPVDSVESIVVHFTGVRLKPQDGEAIDVPFLDADGNAVTREIDMLTLTNGTYATLFGATKVPAGIYNWIQLQVLADELNPDDSYVGGDDGGRYELRIPSSAQNGLRFVSPFTVTADQQTQLLLDWDMRMALIQAPGQGGNFMLRPAFRLIDMTQYGTLTGSVLDTLIDASACPGTLGAGNAVYVYLAADLDGGEPDDIGSSTGPAPVATGIVELDANGLYTYEIILSPGDYRIAYTCAGEADNVEADDDIELVLSPEAIVIDHGATVTVDFS